MAKISLNKTYSQLATPSMTLREDCRYFEVYGGRRSAKSHEVAAILGITAATQPGHFIPVIRKVGATIKDSVFSEYLAFFATAGILHSVNKTDKEIQLQNGSRIRGFGLDDAEKLKSLKGATIIHVEEANEISEDDFDSIDAGLSPTNHPGRIVLTHNPVPQIPGSMHWIQRRFLQCEHELSKAKEIELPGGKALVLRTWYKDNAFCPESTRKVLEGYKETNPEKYKLWALGEFTKMEGAVFNRWDVVLKVPEEVAPVSIGVGLDFGFSNDPSAGCRVWIRGNDLWAKLHVYKTGLSNQMLYDELRGAGVTDRDIISADSARPDIIDDLYRKGFRGIRGVKKRANYKEDIATRLQDYNIHLIEGDTDAIKEISTYSWARDKNGKQLAKLQDGDDHFIDSLIMAMAEYWGDTYMHVPEVSFAGIL